MTFSADVIVMNIIHEYLQPFELAVIENKHTDKTYINAIEFGSVEYLTIYKSACTNFWEAIRFAAVYDQLPAMQLLVEFDPEKIEDALSDAAENGRLGMMRCLVELGAQNLTGALSSAVSAGQLDAIRLLVTLGVDDFRFVITDAYNSDRPESIKLLRELGVDV